MTLQIELPSDTVERLSARARELGKEPAHYVREIIEEDLLVNDQTSRRSEPSAAEWIQEFNNWVASHEPLNFEVDDSRESIYEGRGE